jgi:hypothetical protein
MTTANVDALRDALYYIFLAGDGVNMRSEYRTKGSKNWKPLTDKTTKFDLTRYEYRTVTSRLWLSDGDIECSAGSISTRFARRILELLKKRSYFAVGGYDISFDKHDGSLTVGCQSFTKEDVALARQLLA